MIDRPEPRPLREDETNIAVAIHMALGDARWRTLRDLLVNPGVAKFPQAEVARVVEQMAANGQLYVDRKAYPARYQLSS